MPWMPTEWSGKMLIEMTGKMPRVPRKLRECLENFADGTSRPVEILLSKESTLWRNAGWLQRRTMSKIDGYNGEDQ